MDNGDFLELLKGALDLHVHTSPSIFPRLLNDIEAAEEAKSTGMGGIVLKAHEGSTVERAFIARTQTGFNVFGGLVLNHFVGGFNPFAVDTAVKMGAKIIWMPTIGARNHISFFGAPGFDKSSNAPATENCINFKGYTVLNDRGDLLHEVKDILQIIAESNVTLATGHLSASETLILVKKAIEIGVKRILINHPEWELTAVPLHLQIELAHKGVYLEKSFLSCLPGWGNVGMSRMAGIINSIGPHHCIITTDLGQARNPSPVKGLLTFIQELLKAGLREKDIKMLVCENPWNLID